MISSGTVCNAVQDVVTIEPVDECDTIQLKAAEQYIPLVLCCTRQFCLNRVCGINPIV